MSSIDDLETQMTSVIRSGLRDAMQHILVGSPSPLREVVLNLSAYLHDSLQERILATYTGGYADGAYQIRKAGYIGDSAILGDAITYEDPTIVTITDAAIGGLEVMVAEHTAEIIEATQGYVEKGHPLPRIAAGLAEYFDDHIAATRFARTAVTDIYTRARLQKYKDSNVVDGVQYSAHIDERTSDTCRMLDGTIWALGDSGIRRPPQHFSCRSDLFPYFGEIPGARDFVGEFGSEFVTGATETADTFRSKYWSFMDAAADGAERAVMSSELGAMAELVTDRYPVKPVRALTVDAAYGA